MLANEYLTEEREKGGLQGIQDDIRNNTFIYRPAEVQKGGGRKGKHYPHVSAKRA